MKNKKKKYIATVAEVLLAASVTVGALTGVGYLSGKALANIIEYVGNNYINDNQIDIGNNENDNQIDMGNNEFENYLQISEIESIAKELNFDLSLCSDILRMKHNNGEPIYVSISNEFSDKNKEEIIMALDYIFGVINAINPNYRYQVVDSVSEAEKTKKSVIKFDIDEKMEHSSLNTYMPIHSEAGTFIESLTMKFSPQYLDENKDKDMFVYEKVVNAIYRSFEIKEESETYFGNSFTYTGGCLTPNDYKMFMSIYAEKFNSMEDKEKYIEGAKHIIEEYSEEYYKMRHEQLIQEHLKNGYSPERIKQIFSPIDKNVDIVFSYLHNMTDYNTRTTYKLSLSIKDGIYKISNYDKNNMLVDECVGKAFYINGTYYLQDVILDRFMLNKLTVADIRVSKDDLTKDYSINIINGSAVASNGKQFVSEFENQRQMQ